MKHIKIFDTTLRDGEQCPGASMTVEQKLSVALQLEKLKVDVIEAGFPASSAGDFQSVRAISSLLKSSIVCALARCSRADIEAAANALMPAERKRIHVFISTSPIHMKYKLQKQSHEVLEAIQYSVRLARNHSDDVEWSCEDGTRSDPEFLVRCFETAIQSGATTVNIADTVGYALPTEFGAQIKHLMERVPNISNVAFSVHCHDDLGLAVANSIAAIEAGATQIEATINGIGERAGNAALEEVVMALKTRQMTLGAMVGIRTEELSEASRLVSGITGFVVPPNKAVVGANAFSHESGIHQHGMVSNRLTYEIIDPASVGAGGSKIILGKHSGRHGLKRRLADLGITLSDRELAQLFLAFKDLADQRKVVTDADLLSLINLVSNTDIDASRVQRIALLTGEDGSCRVRVEIVAGGVPRTLEAVGDNWTDATVAAVSNALPPEECVERVEVENVSHGPKPVFLASAVISGRSASATDRDPLFAIVRALVLAMSGIEPRSTQVSNPAESNP